jgi:hypothetical protein
MRQFDTGKVQHDQNHKYRARETCVGANSGFAIDIEPIDGVGEHIIVIYE